MARTISMVRLILLAFFLESVTIAMAAQPKPAWQAEWEKILDAAKKEGQVSI